VLEGSQKKWLIFVEGVHLGGKYPEGYLPGGNLHSVKSTTGRVRLKMEDGTSVTNKLVYSAHDYPNGIVCRPWMMGEVGWFTL
jgi:hypothetical protein